MFLFGDFSVWALFLLQKQPSEVAKVKLGWKGGRNVIHKYVTHIFFLILFIYLFVCCINPHHKQIIALSLPPLHCSEYISQLDACSPNVWTHQMKRWTEAYKYGFLSVRWASVKSLLYHLRISARTSLNSLLRAVFHCCRPVFLLWKEAPTAKCFVLVASSTN